LQERDLLPLIVDNVEKGSTINASKYKTYRNLPKLGYQHSAVMHRRGEYVRGTTHTNTIEGFCSHFKNSVKGTHKSIARNDLQKYRGVLIPFQSSSRSGFFDV
jgi:ISXO2-like transposase domain